MNSIIADMIRDRFVRTCVAYYRDDVIQIKYNLCNNVSFDRYTTARHTGFRLAHLYLKKNII